MRRFNSEKSGYGGEAMTEDPEGDYVLYSDHLENVKAKNLALAAYHRTVAADREIKRSLSRRIDLLESEITKLKGSKR